MASKTITFRLNDEIEEQAICLDLVESRRQVDGTYSKVMVEALYALAEKILDGDGERPVTLNDVVVKIDELFKVVSTRTFIPKETVTHHQQPVKSRFSAVADHLENQKR